MGIGVINLRRCEMDKKGRLMCPCKRGFKQAFSNFDINNNIFVVGGHRYLGREELLEVFDEDVVNEMINYVKASLKYYEE